MELYYLKKQEILEHIQLETLELYSDNRKYQSEEKYLEHLLGLFLTKVIAKTVYGIKNPKIELKNKKPYFTNSNIKFSISHSNDIVFVAFNKDNVGTDIEYTQKRNYSKILKRYNQNIKNPTKEDFYKFWTNYEAEIKLGSKAKARFCGVLEDDYIYTCLSDKPIISNCKVIKLAFI